LSTIMGTIVNLIFFASVAVYLFFLFSILWHWRQYCLEAEREKAKKILGFFVIFSLFFFVFLLVSFFRIPSP